MFIVISTKFLGVILDFLGFFLDSFRIFQMCLGFFELFWISLGFFSTKFAGPTKVLTGGDPT